MDLLRVLGEVSEEALGEKLGGSLGHRGVLDGGGLALRTLLGSSDAVRDGLGNRGPLGDALRSLDTEQVDELANLLVVRVIASVSEVTDTVSLRISENGVENPATDADSEPDATDSDCGGRAAVRSPRSHIVQLHALVGSKSPMIHIFCHSKERLRGYNFVFR